jgi:hypothetical protein
MKLLHRTGIVPKTPTRDQARTSRPGIISATVAAVALQAGVATAQEVPPPEPVTVPATRQLSVSQRPRANYGPLGLRLSQFIVSPSLDVQGVYDTNIYATPSNATSDFITDVSPALTVQSDWTRHALGLRLQGEFKEYAAHSSENVGNLTVAATGRLDIARDVYALGGAGYELLHEDRGAPNVVSGRFPTQYTVTSANAAFVYMPSRLGFRLDGTVDSYGFNNVPATIGPVINETARDRVVYALAPRVTYEITPQYNAFIRAVVNRRQYNSTRQPDGLDRSSTGYEIDAGTALNLAELVSGEIYVGFLAQDYDQPASHTLSGADFGASLLWNMTPIDSLRLNVARTIEESTLTNSLGYLQTTAKLSLEHELLRNIVLIGSLAYLNADFQDAPGGNDFYDASLGGRYYFNRYLSAGLTYDFRYRSAIPLLSQYTRQVIALQLHAQM